MNLKPTSAEINKSRLTTDKVIAEVTQDIMSKQKPDDFDTALTKKINATLVKCFEQFKKMHQIQVVPMRKEDAVEHIRKLYRDEIKTWSKDELIEAFALVQAAAWRRKVFTSTQLAYHEPRQRIAPRNFATAFSSCISNSRTN